MKLYYILNLNLQLFAEAGTRVNTTGGYVNAYDGTKENFDSQNSMDGELKTFYDTELLENARAEMYYAQFAKKQKLPAKHGKTVEWRKWNTFAPATALEEGVIPTGQKFGMSAKQGAIDQFGTYAAISDQLELHAYDDVILGATEEMGASAAETQEMLIRDTLLTNPNFLFCDNINIADGSVESTPLQPTDMKCTETVMSMLTPDMIARAVTIMKKNRVPAINGKYYMVIHPSVAYDLRKHKDWIEAHKYASPEEIFLGEIGELHGCRFIEDTFAPVIREDELAEGISVYASFMFGKDAFGIIDPEGGNMEMILKSKETAGGPLNQFSTVGYKFEQGVVILYPERLLCLLSCSSFSTTDEANITA